MSINEIVWNDFDLFRKRIMWKIEICKNVSKLAEDEWQIADSILLQNRISVLNTCLQEFNEFCEEMQDIQMEKTLKNNY